MRARWTKVWSLPFSVHLPEQPSWPCPVRRTSDECTALSSPGRRIGGATTFSGKHHGEVREQDAHQVDGERRVEVVDREGTLLGFVGSDVAASMQELSCFLEDRVVTSGEVVY